MAWEHFKVTQSGNGKIRDDSGRISDCKYEIGTISTGKSRVFWGYQIRLEIGTDQQIIGNSQGYSETYSFALEDCNRQLREIGLTLLVAGNSTLYSESAMSGGSGYGYIEGAKAAVSIMSFMNDT